VDHQLEDREDPLERRQRPRVGSFFEHALQVDDLVDQDLEPELVDLVNDDEEDLVVLFGAWPLRAEHLLERKVGRVVQRLLLLAHSASLELVSG
jgi:hypothetical protein